MRRIASSLSFAALALAVAALAGGAFPAPASAHVPVLEPARSSDAAPEGDRPFPAALRLPDPSISRAVYGTLAEGEAFDAWWFEVPERVEVPLEALAPADDENEDFRPRLILLGPGLPPPRGLPGDVAGRLALRPGWGAVTVADPGARPRPTFFEPFSLTSYYRGGETRVTLEGGERYVLLVDEPSGGTGEYTVGIGEKESFTAAETLLVPVQVARIKLGLFGQAEFDWGAAAALTLIAAAVVGLPAWLVLRRRRRRGAAGRAAGRTSAGGGAPGRGR